MLFNQELCLLESISLFGLLCNHISQRNPLGIYTEDGIRIISIRALKNRHEHEHEQKTTNKGHQKS